ncbi:hypothetical protein B9Z19DRAFT_1121455 [Tuber borchii]|uniref:Uncharacterized protein n=1 Tax=Tuber borchii TaxID=42251 RepID=A0A2T7A2G2_TUBBO|nr:hypothetical protein B9Z19DRAFT_1121455 [Tuber borchii]
MSDNHTSIETAEGLIPIMASFVPSEETPKPLGDFPNATASMYETYVNLFSARAEKYNTLVASCNYLYENTPGESDNVHIFLLITNIINIAHEGMMEDFAVMEEKLRLGRIQEEEGDLAGLGEFYVLAVPEEPAFEDEEAVVIEVEDADILGAEN